MSKVQQIRTLQTVYRTQLHRVGWLACLFAFVHAVSTKAIGYYIVMQQWFVEEATRSIYDDPIPEPSFWDGEFNLAAGAWGFFLALATIGVGTYVRDKWRNYVLTGNISSTTEPAMRAAMYRSVRDIIDNLPRSGIFEARMVYLNNGVHQLVVDRAETAAIPHTTNGHRAPSHS